LPESQDARQIGRLSSETWPDATVAPILGLSWYGLHVRSNEEHTVAAKLDSAGLENFYPFVTEKSVDGRRDIERKFMPGYVFSRFSLDQKTPVVAIAQVVSILGWGRHAVEIPDLEIAAVRKIVSFPELASPCDFLAAGDKVRVKHGPLVGLEGLVLRWGKKHWIVVSLTSAHRSIKAQVDPLSLEFIGRTK
jgi:transcriptional antiterminator NusG